MLSTSKDECFRRAQGRKIDPTTGVIYHKEDNTAPEGDTKLIERLNSFFGNFTNEEDMIQKIDLNHIQYTDNEHSLKSFMEEFGAFDTQSK